MEKLKIDYKENIVPQLRVEDLEFGAYLLKNLTKQELIIMIKNNNGLSFLESNSFVGFNPHNYPNFLKNYMIIGRINSMEITNIVLQK